jgi:aminobenzoyl-glutamate utilization protein B
MRHVAPFLAFALATQGLGASPKPGKDDALASKREAVASVDRHADELVAMSDAIWGYAETALREHRSSKLLADYAEKQGFTVERGIAGMPTAFVASYGTGRPIIGILGEYDALPGLSQKAAPAKEALAEGAAGHGCGHNLFGAASLGAALAIKEAIAAGRFHGTIRFYGTPAEESVGGKVYMARDGVFRDLDACLAWHPDEKTQADAHPTQAVLDLAVEFRGKAAHAAFDPWNGKSALDGLQLFTQGIEMLREHVKPTARMHYVIQDGGSVPNVVPEHAKLWFWIRDATRADLEETLRRARKIAEGAALMAEVEVDLRIQAGSWEMLINQPGAKLVDENLAWLGPITFTDEEQAFARAIQRATGVPEKGVDGTIHPFGEQELEGGSSDVADVSWNVPVLNLVVTTAPVGTPWHAWPVVATGGMSIGHKGLLHAAKAMAATMVDLYRKPAVLEAIRSDFAAKSKGTAYKAYLPDGPPPLPKD